MSAVATLNLPSINWALFDDSQHIRIEKLLETGHVDLLGAALDSITPEQEAELAKMQAALRPRNFVFTSKKQVEFEQWLSQHSAELTPDVERKWQAEIEKERQDYLESVSGGLKVEAEVKNESGTNVTTITTSNKLEDVEGLDAESIKLLNDFGVFSVESFKKMSFNEKRKVIGFGKAVKFRTFQ